MRKLYKLNRIFSNEEGSGLVLALMVLLVLSVLGSALGMVTINSHRLADHTQDTNSAYYIAEAGANMAYEEFKAEILSIYEDSASETAFLANLPTENNKPAIDGTIYGQEVFQSSGGIQPTAGIEVILPTASSKLYKINSTGVVGDKVRSVEKDVTVTWVKKKNDSNIVVPIIHRDTAIIYKSKITFKNNSLVTGDIYNDGSGKEDGYKNVTHNGVLRNGIIKDGNIEWSRYVDLVNSFPSQPKYNNTLVYKSMNTLILEENTYIEEMKISKNLTIDTKGKTVYLIVDDLEIGANINILGQGKVNLYITNKLKISSNNLNINSTGNTNQINIMYAGNQEVSLFNNSSFNGTIFFKEANMIFEQNTTIEGTIISGGNRIILNQNAAPNTFIIAPNSHTVFNQNTILNGTIIADEITLNQNSKVNRSHRTVDEFPFNNSDEIDGGSSTSNIEDLIFTEPATEN